MNTFLTLLLIAAMIATVVALVRGVIAFLQESTAQVKKGEGPSQASLKSNRMMQPARLLPGAGHPDRGRDPVRGRADLIWSS